MPHLPSTSVSLFFIAITFLTLWFVYKSTHSIVLLIVSVIWMAVQSMVAHANFYLDSTTFPPRPILLIGPPILFILLLFITKRGKIFIDTFDIKWLTYLHSIRIPVEIVLLILFMHQLVPQLMTFEGRNFDIISGLTAPVIAYLYFTKRSVSKKIVLAWNFICLALILNIVINALLSMPTVLQKQAFDQPNIGLLYAPYVFLPCYIVPAVLLSHLVCIRKLSRS
jgi:hypothetical protein